MTGRAQLRPDDAKGDVDVRQRTWLSMLALWLAACDGGAANPDAGPPDAGGGTRAAVVGEVRYEGDADGSLLVGVFPWDEAHPSQPTGPPVDFVPVDAPGFPFPYEIGGIRPGSYFVGAVLDVGRDDPTIPGEEDLEAYTGRLELAPGDRIEVDLVLEDGG